MPLKPLLVDMTTSMNTMKHTTNKNKLRARRITQGIKQIELAARAGVSLATVNKTERWGFPVSKPTAAKLAKVLRCKPSEIFPDGSR